MDLTEKEIGFCRLVDYILKIRERKSCLPIEHTMSCIHNKDTFYRKLKRDYDLLRKMNYIYKNGLFT
jgi:hypothetical protein